MGTYDSMEDQSVEAATIRHSVRSAAAGPGGDTDEGVGGADAPEPPQKPVREMNPIELTAALLREPGRVVEVADDPAALAEVAPRLLGIAAVSAAIFGVAVGSYRGGVQTVYAAVKMPALMLIPLVVALPGIRALIAACEIRVSYARLALAGLAGMARTAVLAAGLGPVLWLIYSVDADYHLSVLLMAGALGIAGLPGLAVIYRAIPPGGRRRWVAAAGSVALLGTALAQSGWLLRPFIARPAAEVTFLRPLEEDVFSSLAATSRSARGDYRRWHAEPVELMEWAHPGEDESQQTLQRQHLGYIE